MTRVLSYSILAGVVLTITGCASPLKSDDPATRLQAVSELSDSKELMLIAMNIGVYIGQKSGSYYNAFLTQENYAEDVRVAAVNRLTDISALLRCATWQDGDVYVDSGMDQGRLEYKGENYYVHESTQRLQQKIASGSAVRDAAIRRLSDSELFSQIVVYLEQLNEDGGYGGKTTGAFRAALFPSLCNSSMGHQGSSFVDYHGTVRKGNPLDLVLTRIVRNQCRQQLIRSFLVAARENGPSVFPGAMISAVEKLDESDQQTLISMYRKLFCHKTKNHEMPPGVVKKAYCLIEDKDTDMILAALRYSTTSDLTSIIADVKDQKAHVGVFCFDKFYTFVSKEEQTSLYCPLDVIKTDVKLDVAKALISNVTDNEILSHIALKAPLFNVRYAAISQINNDAQLALVALDPMKDCPYDTSAAGFDLISNRIEWWKKNERQSSFALRKLAISRIKDAVVLRQVRCKELDVEIKKSVTEKLVSLGCSDTEEIIAAEKYDESLFVMLSEIKGKKDLMQIAASAKLKGVRLLAANQLPKAERVAICKKELPDKAESAPDGRLTFGGLFLGMNIEDAFAVISAQYAEIKPKIYLDDNVLCISTDSGMDLVWANLSTCEVHWMTLPPKVVKRIVGFKTGTFSDLERQVESRMGISFSSDLISKRNVSQKVGNYETVDGETFRYFSSAIGYGEDFKRSVRKSINQYTIDYQPMNGGLGAVFANAFEDAMQSEENARDAHSPRFAPQGSIQLQWTKNAIKGDWSSTGGSSNVGIEVLHQTLPELESLGSQLEGALNQLNSLSL